jgi:hypothetical protein
MDPRRLKLAGALAAALLLGLAAGAWLKRSAAAPRPDPLGIASSTLLALRDQGRIIPFSARYAAVVSASESRLGLTARKTLVLPATVRYGVDLTRLKRSDLAWDEATRTLTVTLPPLEISAPSVDMEAVQESSEGGVLMALSDAERALDQANNRSAQAEIMRQSRDRIPMQLARNSAMRTVAGSFALPLRAAGIDASVAVRLLDASGHEEAAWLDRPRALDTRLRDRQAGR